jgi:hypothetical protein
MDETSLRNMQGTVSMFRKQRAEPLARGLLVQMAAENKK